MKRSVLFSASFALLFFAGTALRADMVSPPPELAPWTYSVSRDPTLLPGGIVASDAPGTGGVNFTAEQTKSASGNSDVVLSNLRVFSAATADKPETLITGGNWALTLTLTDSTSGQTGNVTFAGKLSGKFSAEDSNVTTSFTSAITQFLTLGNFLYTVTIGPYSPPGPPSASNAGSIAAHVDLTPAGIDVQKVPEPSSVVLSCLGVSFLAASWRKRRPARV
jgi:hypothetical protein